MKLPKGLSIVPVQGLKVVRLYNTNIVVIDYNNNTITFNSNGWNTRHTKKCTNLVINDLDLYLYQEKFQWYIRDAKTQKVYEYQDGLQLPLGA